MALLANGYTPLPCSCETKRPVLTGWPDAKVTAESINAWDIQFPKAQNHGLRLEALDLDISDQDVCEDLESIIRDWFDGRGEILTRFGSPPRRLIPIRVTGDLTKTSRLFKDPSGKQQGLELLGTRSQFLAYGMHPKGYAYSWFGDRGPRNVPIASLPQVPAEEATQLFQHLCEVLVERHGYTDISQANGHDKTADAGGADFDADEALATMQPTPASVEDTQRRVILSYLQRGIHPDDIHAKVVSATMKVQIARPNSDGLGKPRISLSPAASSNNLKPPAGTATRRRRGGCHRSFASARKRSWTRATNWHSATTNTAGSSDGRAGLPSTTEKRSRLLSELVAATLKTAQPTKAQAMAMAASARRLVASLSSRLCRLTRQHCRRGNGFTAATICAARSARLRPLAGLARAAWTWLRPSPWRLAVISLASSPLSGCGSGCTMARIIAMK
jgi:hypothetical protein